MKKISNWISDLDKSQWFMITVSAILFVLGIQSFVQVAHIFPAGVGAFASGITFIFNSLIPYVNIIYLALNIPLIMFAIWKKVKPKFIIKTIYFLVLQAAFGTVFIYEPLTNYVSHMVWENSKVISDVWPVFILAILGGFVNGLATAISYRYGGSTGGSDIIVYYYSTQKKKQIGTSSIIISIFFVFIGFGMSIVNNEEMKAEWLPILAATFIYIAIIAFIVNMLYPKYSKINVYISSTNKIDEIINHLRDSKYNHAFQIIEYTAGYSLKKNRKIFTTMLLLEFKSVKDELEKIDPNIWISASLVKRQVGIFNTAKVE